MRKNVEECLNALYPDIDSLTPDEMKKYEKEKRFLEAYWPEFSEMFERRKSMIEKVGINRYTRLVIDLCKKQHDPETIIIDYIEGIAEAVGENSFINENFESFVNMLSFGRKKEKEGKDAREDKTPISLDTVFDLTEEFLGRIDESQGLLDEFKNLRANGGIELLDPYGEKESHYSHCENKIRYKFDGTVNSAYTLVHEFMHHLCTKQSETVMGYHNFTLLREFLSIYYENAFIDFMDEKGMLPNGTEPLMASRFKSEYEMDPDNCLGIYFDCYGKFKRDGSIDREGIEEVLKERFPDIEDADELWNHGAEMLTNFSEEHYFPIEIGAGLTMYKFGTAIAHYTPQTPEMHKKVHKLASVIKDGEHDFQAIQQYLLTIGQQEFEFSKQVDDKHEDEPKILTTMDIARRTLPNAELNDKNIISRIISRWRERANDRIGGDRND
ncbi:MAG: hypothetical protein IJX99_04710 [Clostridia bacterium]|nr:hypothetical protein [Clostridia bacterium]